MKKKLLIGAALLISMNCMIAIAGTITTNMPLSDAKKLLTDAGAKEVHMDIIEETETMHTYTFALTDGSVLELSVEKSNERIKTIEHCDALSLRQGKELRRWRKITAYELEKKDSQQTSGESTNREDKVRGKSQK